MSSEAEHGERGAEDPESGLAALRECGAVRGPVGPVDGHDHANDHVAMLYDDRDEQLATVAAFLRQGLERGEQCVYVVDDNERADVLAALRDAGVDVDDARSRGALSIHDADETYRRTGAFDRETMLEFWRDRLDAARDSDFAGVRATAEMTWVLEDETSSTALVDYEAVLNDLYDGEDYVVCCQYNTERFAPSVLRDVVRTHPHVVEGDVVHDNVYYTPPSEFLDPEDAGGELERMLDTLRDRTGVQAELQAHKRYLRELHEITADGDRSFEATVERLLELGRERFDLRGGALTLRPSTADRFCAEVTHGPELPEPPAPIPVQPGEDRFCRRAVASDEPVAVHDVAAAGWDDDPIAAELGVGAYLGVRVSADTDPYGTLWFYDTSPRAESFSADERTFLELMAQWVGNELERTRRHRAQRQLYEIVADSDRSFDDKLQALFDLGCDRFDLDLGGLARVDPENDRLQLQAVSGEHDSLAPGETYSLSATYCQEPVTEGGTASVTDPHEAGYGDELCYREFGVHTYLGTYLTVDGAEDRTFWFASETAREEPFSPAERTFLHLMGQWVTYELEREQYEADLESTVEQLQQSNDRLTQFAYAASHDLQEPLRMISSHLRLLESEHADALDEDALECVDFAVDGADRMRAMVEDLLAYSRIEQADQTFTTVDCDVIVERVLDDLQVQIDERDATVEVGPLPTIHADPEQVEQLLRNLVSNAIKYGGRDEPPTVRIGAEAREDCWALSIEDDGIGIPREKTDRIFEVFQRLHHDDEYVGTGIGLALCQEIAEHHGGEIAVDSEPGVGSTFTVTLPCRDER